MISLSVTFFIQIVNFFICWFMLDRLLFRQCTVELFRERAVKQEHQDQLLRQKQLLDRTQQEEKALVRESRRQFQAALPNLCTEKGGNYVSGHSFVHLQQCDLQTQQTIAKELVNSLVQRITRG